MRHSFLALLTGMTTAATIDFQTEVLEHTGTVVVDFFTPGCYPCRIMAPLLEEIARESNGQLKVVKIDASENLELAAQFQVNVAPTFLLFLNGRIKGQRMGSCSKREFLNWINSSVN